ncbi:MAG: hypothetical protein ACD_73C00032G0002 [uncultured bacterium]|nr:MAG: hypothetical protein ACD_73C00032G0002 [uncultured bacterium]
MRRHFSLIVFIFIIASLNTVFAADKKDQTCPMPKQVSSPAFDLLKSLSGTWKGTWVVGDRKQPMQVKYRVTSGGTAVEETIFPNTPQEMVSVYTLRDGKVHMTHYCMLGNQPHMIETDSDAHHLRMKFTKTPGINPKKDSYMGGLNLIKKDDHHIIYSGDGFKEGKPQPCNEMVLTK